MKKIVSLFLVFVLIISTSQVAFALNYEDRDTPGSRLVHSLVPTKFLDISKVYNDQCNGANKTAYSEFYFNSGSAGRVNISSIDISGAKEGDFITIQFMDYNKGTKLAAFNATVVGGMIKFNYNADLPKNTDFYTMWWINEGNKLTGRYSIVQN